MMMTLNCKHLTFSHFRQAKDFIDSILTFHNFERNTRRSIVAGPLSYSANRSRNVKLPDDITITSFSESISTFNRYH